MCSQEVRSDARGASKMVPGVKVLTVLQAWQPGTHIQLGGSHKKMSSNFMVFKVTPRFPGSFLGRLSCFWRDPQWP